MKRGPGIRAKLLVWYLALLTIFYGTILVLFFHIHRISRVSDRIVNTRYGIAALSNRLIQDLLTMEENEKKYQLLRKVEYIDLFWAAKGSFEKGLAEIIRVQTPSTRIPLWEEIQSENRVLWDRDWLGAEGWAPPSEPSWLPERMIDGWTKRIFDARSENQSEVEREFRGVYETGVIAFRWGMLGLGASVGVGLLGLVLITYSINRPLRALRTGIRSIRGGGQTEPIPIRSGDELGEVARAFNDLAGRLAQEERMRSDFIAMISHEIRTPLTSIGESVNLIEEELAGPINEKQRRLLRIAREEMKRVTELLRTMMQVSRMEAGMVGVEARPLAPIRVVRDCLARVAPLAEGGRIRIRAQVSPSLPLVLGDEAQLRQVLLNLLGNAIKFSTAGGDVAVRVEREAEQPFVRFSVSDGGPGIPDQEQSLVFQKYYRVSGEGGPAEGMGLGLSISKHIIEAHGGTMGLESRLGEGSTFFFTLPETKKG
jgi:signal transduction histidine kinase